MHIKKNNQTYYVCKRGAGKKSKYEFLVKPHNSIGGRVDLNVLYLPEEFIGSIICLKMEIINNRLREEYRK